MGLTRRELLSAFLGAPVAACAARGPRPPRLPPGELAGASVDLGHLVRGAAPVVPPDGAWLRTTVAIVGGGVAGLAAAWRLARAGVDFTVFELEPELGGTARAGVSAASPFPWGAHYVTAPMQDSRDMIALLGELGALDGVDADGEPRVAELGAVHDPEERVFYRGRWYEGLYLRAGASAADLAELAAFQAEIDRWSAWRDARGRRAFAIPTRLGSDDAEVLALDRSSMAAWLDAHGWRSPRLRWLVDYACRDDYGARADAVSAWAGVFYFAARQTRPGAPARPVITWPEGNGFLVRHLARAAAGRTRTGLVVVDVAPVAGGVELVALDASGRAVGVRAERAIVAAPDVVRRRIVRPLRGTSASALPCGAWMVANLFLRDRPEEEELPLAWDNVLYESPGLGYVVATHQADVARGPTVLTYYYPLADGDADAGRRRLLAVDRDGWADVTLTDLARAHPDLRGLCTRLDVMRWGHAMVRPVVGLRTGGALAAAARPIGAIHMAHSDLSGVALFEEALDQGLRAAGEVIAARRAPAPAPDPSATAPAPPPPR